MLPHRNTRAAPLWQKVKSKPILVLIGLIALLAVAAVVMTTSSTTLSTLVAAANQRELTTGKGKKKKGLIIIDIQKDFVGAKGSLSVFGDAVSGGSNSHFEPSSPGGKNNGQNYVQSVNAFLAKHAKDYAFIVYSIDYHPPNHCSFVHDWTLKPDASGRGDCKANAEGFSGTSMWPPHCVQDTEGSKFSTDIYRGVQGEFIVWKNADPVGSAPINFNVKQATKAQGHVKGMKAFKHAAPQSSRKAYRGKTFYLFKGRDRNVDSFSAFLGNDHVTSTGLKEALGARQHGFTPANTEIHVLGVAYEFCVFNTAKDAKFYKYDTKFISDLTMPVRYNNAECSPQNPICVAHKNEDAASTTKNAVQKTNDLLKSPDLGVSVVKSTDQI